MKIPSRYFIFLLLLITLFLSLPHINATKAETVDLLPKCTGTKCFSELTDLSVSNDGSFLLIIDSGAEPYVQKVNIDFGMASSSSIIPLDDANPTNIPLKIGISKDAKKAFVFSSENRLISNSSSGEFDIFSRLNEPGRNSTLLTQVDQGTDCRCSTSTYFDDISLVCVSGTLDCSNALPDAVCSCDKLNFLNSCTARANGVKKFTKGECSSTSNLTCSSDSQCPTGTCPDGMTFKKFTCTTSMCTLTTFSSDPCTAAPDASCKCTSGAYFDGSTCVSGTLDCTGIAEDTVCGCNNLNFLNNCISRANGIKTFTKGACGSDAGLSCTSDSQCPLGTCSNGPTFKRFTCTNNECMPITFSSDPCFSTSTADCRCSSGAIFDGQNCVAETLKCTGVADDPICSCDNLNFLNNCIAKANGVKKFTKGACGSDSGLNCASDSQCPVGTCPAGSKFKRFTCTGGKCVQIVFSVDPCSSSDGFDTSLYRIIDLENNSVTRLTPTTKSTNSQKESIIVLNFLDSEGERIIAGTEDEDSPKLLLIEAKTGRIERKPPPLPGIIKSIEMSPNFGRAVITFKDDLAQTISIFSPKVKELNQFDIPSKIIFKADEFLSMIDFDLLGSKAVVSSLDGNHILHVLNLIENRLIIRFLNNDVRGQTLSTISLDGSTAISAGNNNEGGKITVYKVSIGNLRKPRIIKFVSLNDISNVLDVQITPDNDKVLLLVLKENEKRLKVLSIHDLSLLCEFVVSSDVQSSFLLADPFGRYYLTPNFKDDSVSIVSDLKVGPVLRSIIPLKGSKSGGTQFNISGFIDPDVFTDKVKVCFGGSTICSNSTTISNDGKTITGTTPRFPKAGVTSVTLIAEKKPNISTASSSSSQCPVKIITETKYERMFQFESEREP